MSRVAAEELGIKPLDWKAIMEYAKKIKIDQQFIGKLHSNYDEDH